MAKSSRKNMPATLKLVRVPKTEVHLEISLLDIEPRIWRSFAVPGTIRLDRLHLVIQEVMGWTNSHLHSFRQGAHEYVRAEPGSDWNDTRSDAIIHDEAKHTLRDLVRAEGDRFNYSYDFGDGWEHVVVATAILPMVDAMKHADCLAGERACPPEDCGGPSGYRELCEALPNRKHPQHKHWKGWLSRYDPEAFDRNTVNEYLEQLSV